MMRMMMMKLMERYWILDAHPFASCLWLPFGEYIPIMYTNVFLLIWSIIL